ncbi:hypothetical protein PR048_026577 [Dryococelus australis]|uniref:DUF5641 domain-containing protein n=1 Tax=Dryococelus australis TaxID=614101 RepID=A0ABQ9GLR1_9NEOP|nr:hypothetical protein PR048_026577 [Dryococelus australis]
MHFESSVDKNVSVSTINKHVFLREYLGAEPKRLVEGIAVTADTCKQTKNILKITLIQAYTTLGEDVDVYGKLLGLKLLRAFPDDFCRRWLIHAKISSIQEEEDSDKNYNTANELNRLTHLPFDLTSSPSLLSATIWEAARFFSESFPFASAILDRTTFMDGFTACGYDDNYVITLYYELTKLLKNIKLPLAKWVTCLEPLRNIWKIEGREIKSETSIMGVVWNTTDVQTITKDMSYKPETKWNIPSVIAKVFDPLGLFTPVTVIAKCYYLLISHKDGMHNQRLEETEATLQLNRVRPIRPFGVTGIDIAGPLFIIFGKQTKKSYIVLFTCATTRTIHLELVRDISTDRLLTAIQRFAGRPLRPTLNSRDLSQDADSNQVLTPAHFLNGERLTSIPNGPELSTERDLTRVLHHKQRVAESFWLHWKREYLSLLKNYHEVKGQQRQHKLRVGDIVLLQDDTKPRHMWKRARI